MVATELGFSSGPWRSSSTWRTMMRGPRMELDVKDEEDLHEVELGFDDDERTRMNEEDLHREELEDEERARTEQS